MAQGDFSASQLQNIMLQAESMWADGQQSLKPANAVAAVAVKTNSTATVDQLKGQDGKDNKVTVTWINPCAVTADDCVSNCDLTEPELSTNKKDYDLTRCKKSGFSINVEKVRTNSYSAQQQAAVGLATAVKKLDEWWAQQVLVVAKASAGINVHPQPYTFAAGTTTVPAANYDITMIPQLLLDAQMNQITNPYFISNEELWNAYYMANINQGNLDGKGDKAMADLIKMNFDLWNFGPAGLTDDLFMIGAGALAFVTKNRNPDTPEVVGGTVQQTIYTINSSVIPGVKYDVYYTIKCVTNTTTGKAEYFNTWRVETNGDVLLNPEGCPVTVSGTTYNPTGVLSYTKGS